MGAAFLITFRETLEAALVVGIIFAFLLKAGLVRLKPAVWFGAGSGLAISILAAYLFIRILGEFEGKPEQLLEGIVMLAGAFLLSTLILWLNKGDIKAATESKVAASAGAGGWWGIALLVFVSVLREGIETVVFISSVIKGSDLAAIIGAVVGIGAALLIGFAFFRSGARMQIKGFFKATNFLLILFAAGLVGRGVHELNEAGVIPGIIDQVWNLNPPGNDAFYPALHENGLIGSLLKGLFGYNGNPSLSEVVAYLAYLASVSGILLARRGRTHKISTRK